MSEEPGQSAGLADLDYIYVQCAEYMTDKAAGEPKLPWRSGQEREAHYKAFTTLLGDVVREIEALGGRTLSGPKDFPAAGV